MRSQPSSFEIKTPKNIAETLNLLQTNPSYWKPFAGGTDLMVLYEAGHLHHHHYLNLWNLAELKGIEVNSKWITLGSLTTFTEIRKHPIIQREFPNLIQAARETGAISIQNRGTLGGNIANASPAADSPPALLTYDADIELMSERNSKWIAYSDFHLGYKKTVLAPNELITRVRLPRTENTRFHYYRKVGTRKAQSISKVCFSGTASFKNQKLHEVKIALGSVAPIPLRCHKVEALVLESYSKSSTLTALGPHLDGLLGQEICPIDDIRSTSKYRLKVAENLLAEFIEKLKSCGIGSENQKS